MSADRAFPAADPGRIDAVFEWLQMLSGVCLTLFMAAHAVMLASVHLGAPAMDALAAWLESAGLVQMGGPVIFLLFLLHFAAAARRAPWRIQEQAVFWRHARAMRHADTWLWLAQAGTGLILLILGPIHIWTALVDLPVAAAKSAARVGQWPWLVLYGVLLAAVTTHLCAGCYRIGVKWGFVQRANRAWVARRLVWLLVGLLTLGLFNLMHLLLLSL